MKSKQRCGFLARPWFVWLGMVVLLGGVAVAVGGHVPANQQGHRQYADGLVLGRGAPGGWHGESRDSWREEHGTGGQLRESDVAAFHEAAEKVLPSVVMITNTPRWEHNGEQQAPLPMTIRKRCLSVSRARPSATCSKSGVPPFFQAVSLGPMPEMPEPGMVVPVPA